MQLLLESAGLNCQRNMEITKGFMWHAISVTLNITEIIGYNTYVKQNKRKQKTRGGMQV